MARYLQPPVVRCASFLAGLAAQERRPRLDRDDGDAVAVPGDRDAGVAGGPRDAEEPPGHLAAGNGLFLFFHEPKSR